MATTKNVPLPVRPLPHLADTLLRALLFVVLGWAAWRYGAQLRDGLADSGMNRPVFWGIHSANFIFCVGVSAGAAAVAAIVHVLDRRELKSLARVAELAAIVSLALAVAFIVLELGRPDRMISLLLHAHFASPLVWDVLGIGSFLPLVLAMLYFDARADVLERADGGWRRVGALAFSLGRTSLSERSRRTDRRALRAVSVVVLPWAAAVHSVTAWILGLLQAQPGWNTPLLGTVFLTSALISGLAAVIVLALAARPMFLIEVPDGAVRRLTAFLVGLAPLLLYFLFSEFLTAIRSGRPAEAALYREILAGRFAAIFWFDIVLGLLLPLALLTVGWGRRSMGRIALASVLLLAGVLAERVYILLPSLMQSHGFAGRNYTPTAAEWLLMAGAYAGGALAFLALMELLVPRRRAARAAASERATAVPIVSIGT